MSIPTVTRCLLSLIGKQKCYEMAAAACRTRQDLYGYVDETGREVIPCRFEKAISFYGEVTPACLNGLYGLIDKDGEFISTPRYEAMGVCDVDVFYFYENGLYGFVDAERKN